MRIQILAKNSRLATLTSGFLPSKEELFGTRRDKFRKNRAEVRGSSDVSDTNAGTSVTNAGIPHDLWDPSISVVSAIISVAG